MSAKVEHKPKSYDPFGLRALFNRPARLFWINFAAGIFRGIGFSLGFTVVAALLLSALRPAQKIPVLGHYISRFLDAAERQPPGGSRESSERPAKNEKKPAPAAR